MYSSIFLFICALLLTVNFSLCSNYKRDSKEDHQLIINRRSFINFIDEEKLISYLSSFGSNPSAEESRKHMIYKRASGRIKKVKKSSTTNSSSIILELNKKQRRDEKSHVPKNFTSPKHLVKFELEDAKYNEEYEQLRKGRKLRIKRSSNNETNGKSRKEKHILTDLFVQPKEFLKFVYSDALISTPLKASANEDQLSKSEKKIKREVSAFDSTTSDTKKIKITHPLSSTSRTKHVSFEELPTKLQKVVESAISDAILKGKASDGDHLKFYYADKIIKVPVSLSKYISSIKESSPKGLADYYTTYKTQKFQKEEWPTLKYTSNAKHEKAQSYSNFVTLKKNSLTQIEKELNSEYPAKKSIYFFSNADEKSHENSPIHYESSLKSYEKGIYDKKNILYTSAPKEIVREVIPITEDFNESEFVAPIYPTSYVEYDDNLAKKPIESHGEKNYAFGYHVSDFKSGNNFGHTQSKNNKEIKGEYSILLPDGKIQITKYFADDSGFHADVSYQTIH